MTTKKQIYKHGSFSLNSSAPSSIPQKFSIRGTKLYCLSCFFSLFLLHPVLFKLHLKLKLPALFMLLSILLCRILTWNVSASIKATSVSTIHGSAPYLTFDGGVTKATDMSALLSITLSDGRIYTKNDNPSSESNPIILPVAGQSINDVSLYIPKNKASIALNDLIGEPYNFWRDDDGDVMSENEINVTGNLNVIITDKNNNIVARTDVLGPCSSPYKVQLNATNGVLRTQYGDPNLTEFDASSVEYYIQPKINTPYACFAKPNLQENYGTQPEWDYSNGFKVQSLSDPQKNFPRTGFNNAFFDIAIMGTKAQSIIDTMGTIVLPESGKGVKLFLKASPNGTDDNILRVTLSGPSNNSKGGVFTASTFKLKSGLTEIYSFEVSKWFIAKTNTESYSDALTYCDNLIGSYRVPSVSEYTNANGMGWTGGLLRNNNRYARAIGNGKQKIPTLVDDGKGGVFAEWGSTGNNYYKNSDFDGYYFFWAYDTKEELQQYDVYSPFGSVDIAEQSDIRYDRPSCVTP